MAETKPDEEAQMDTEENVVAQGANITSHQECSDGVSKTEPVEDASVKVEVKENGGNEKEANVDNKEEVQGKEEENEEEEEEEEDDVPENFFDDLMSEDFIDGLNVVDAWDESDTMKMDDVAKSKERKSPVRFPSKSPFNTVKVNRMNRNYRERSPLRRHSRKSPTPPRTERLKVKKTPASKKKNKEKDVRRDPSKTKRDIQKHKDKCAKDEEARIISEKLKVCETGLVPPGTEMDVDLEKLVPKKEEKKKQPSKSKRVSAERSNEFLAKYADRRSRSLERILERRKRERIRTLERISMERRSLERRIKMRRSLERRRSYLLLRSRSRSPRRRSPLLRRSRSIERRNLAERKSPTDIFHSRRKKISSQSPPSDISDRESWLRNKLRARSRSGSPLSKRSRSFLRELNRLSKPAPKKSFLKELEEKLYPLDVTNTPPPNMMPPMPHHQMPPNPNFPPGPVGPPMPVPHPSFPMQQEYDQQFFIGPQPEMVPPPFGRPLEVMPGPPPFPGPPQMGGFMPPQGPPEISHRFPPQHHPGPFPRPPMTPINMSMRMPQPNVMINPQQTRPPFAERQGGLNLDDYKTLLEEKKITLSDYLSLTAKFTDNTKPVDIKNKIKVISRCQGAVKELSEDSKLGGSFQLRRSRKSIEKSLPEVDNKIQSPFRKITAVRFGFTTQKQQSEDKANVSQALNRLLVRIGQDPIFNSPKASPIPPVDVAAPIRSQVEKTPLLKKIITLDRSVQTVKTKCKECETRNAIKTNSIGIQSLGVLSFDVSCQFPEETFQKRATISKNQSLAHLTPAQLLAAQSVDDDDSPPRDLFPAARKIPSLLELPSDTKSMRMGASSYQPSSQAIDLTSSRFGSSYDIDRFGPIAERDRYFNKPPAVSPKRPPLFDRPPVMGGHSARPLPFANFSSKLNFEPSGFLKSRNTGPVGESSRPFFEPPPPKPPSGGFQQGGNRF